MSNVTLYQIPQVVLLHTSDALTNATVMNRTDFSIFRGIGNEVEFLIKTVDRKPYNLTGKSLIIRIVDRASKSVVLSKPLVSLSPLEDSRGHQRFAILPGETANLANGTYEYSVVEQTADYELAVFSDQNKRLMGNLQVCDGPTPDPKPQVEIQQSTFLFSMLGIPAVATYIAESFKGAAQLLNASGQHTAAFYTTGFTGTFKIEASLSNSPPGSPSDWFDVFSTTVTNKTGVTPAMFVGNYMWVRFTYIPAPTNTGSFNKVMFKA